MVYEANKMIKGNKMKNSIRKWPAIFVAVLLFLATSGCMKNETKYQASAMSSSNSGGQKKVVLGPVYFDYNKTVLTPEAMSCLYNLGMFLVNNPGYRLIIEGYADERGDSQYDKYVSEERAKSVFNWLVLYGAYHIDAKRVEMRSYGSERPAFKNCGTDTACHAKNRRVELDVFQ